MYLEARCALCISVADGSSCMFHSSFHAGIAQFISSLALLCTLAAGSMILSAFRRWCFCQRSIVGAFVGVQLLVLLLAFDNWCFCQRSIVGAFFGIRSSVLSLAFDCQ